MDETQRVVLDDRFRQHSITVRFLLAIVRIMLPSAPPALDILSVLQQMDRDTLDSLKAVISKVQRLSTAPPAIPPSPPHRQQATSPASPSPAAALVRQTASEQRSVIALTSLRQRTESASDYDAAGLSSDVPARHTRSQRRLASEVEEESPPDRGKRRRVEANNDAAMQSVRRTTRHRRQRARVATQPEAIFVSTGDSHTLPSTIRSVASTARFQRFFVADDQFLIASTNDAAASAYIQAAPSTNVAPLSSIREYLLSYRATPSST